MSGKPGKLTCQLAMLDLSVPAQIRPSKFTSTVSELESFFKTMFMANKSSDIFEPCWKIAIFCSRFVKGLINHGPFPGGTCPLFRFCWKGVQFNIKQKKGTFFPHVLDICLPIDRNNCSRLWVSNLMSHLHRTHSVRQAS